MLCSGEGSAAGTLFRKSRPRAQHNISILKNTSPAKENFSDRYCGEWIRHLELVEAEEPALVRRTAAAAAGIAQQLPRHCAEGAVYVPALHLGRRCVDAGPANDGDTC